VGTSGCRQARRTVALAVAATLLGAIGGCTTSPTPYGPATDGYGYSDQQIEQTRYRVSFAGNSATSRETVENYLLYRAAQLTVQNGYDYFTLVNQGMEGYGSGFGGPRVGVGVGGGGGGDVGLGVGISTLLGGGSSPRYTGFADVVMYRGEKPSTDTSAYDAREILRRLRPETAPAGG
jgi:hypothetical protein